MNFTQPVDLFLLIGHKNPARRTDPSSTFGLLHDTIRNIRPTVPIQIFGGHSHIRDFQVYDDISTALESGRYCETLGWLSISGIKSDSYTGISPNPRGVANPTRPATSNSTSGLVYSRRYLDWNRLTFEYHATSSQESTLDYHSGLRVTQEITDARKELNLTSLYGCTQATYCESCQPAGAAGNIFTLVQTVLAAEVVNASRSTIPRYIIVNTGSIRFDLVKGPFTYDDSFIVSPFTDAFQYINAPYSLVRNVINSLSGAALVDKRDGQLGSMPQMGDGCIDPTISLITLSQELKVRGIFRRQTVVTPGYTTTDDFGPDGDDTVHSKIPQYSQPNYVQGNASFPTDGTTPATVDVIFLNYFASTVVSILNKLGGKYTSADVNQYRPPTYTTQSYLPAYAQKYWQANVPNCPVVHGVGYSD